MMLFYVFSTILSLCKKKNHFWTYISLSCGLEMSWFVFIHIFHCVGYMLDYGITLLDYYRMSYKPSTHGLLVLFKIRYLWVMVPKCCYRYRHCYLSFGSGFGTLNSDNSVSGTFGLVLVPRSPLKCISYCVT